MQQFGGWYRGFRERLLSSPSSSASSATAPASLDKDSRLPRVGREGVGRGVWGQKEGILETCKLLTAGGVAGAFAKTCTAPLSRLTILYQAILSHLLQNSHMHGKVCPRSPQKVFASLCRELKTALRTLLNFQIRCTLIT